MANDTLAFGLRRIKTLSGAPLSDGGIRKFFVAAADSAALYVGQLVKHATMVTTGNTAKLPTVAAYVAGDTNVAGVVVAVEQVEGIAVGSENFTRKHRPGSTAMIVHVDTSPDTVYEVRCDNGGAALAGADLLENADVVVGTGSAISGMSATIVDSSTHADTATLPLRLLKFSEQIGNTPAANDTIVEVILNTLPARTTTGLAL